MIHVQKCIAACLATAVLFAATAALAFDESPEVIKQRIGTGNPVKGKTRSELCQGCHGEVGLSLEDLILRSPLKVAAQDDHNADVQGLHQTLVAGMLPCHVVQAAIRGK